MRIASYLFHLANVCCEKCLTKLKLQDIKAREALICSSCGHAMPLSETQLAFDKSLVRPSPQVSIQREASIFRIEKKWFSKSSKYIIGTSLILSFSLAGVIWYGVTSPAKGLILFLPAAVLLIYRSAQEIFNTTTILIKSNKLVVGTSPLSLTPVKIYQTSDIEKFTLWRPHLLGKQQGHPIFAFGVDIKLKNGSTHKLCPAADLNEAIYIEKTIEEFLSIEDTAVVDLDAI